MPVIEAVASCAANGVAMAKAARNEKQTRSMLSSSYDMTPGHSSLQLARDPDATRAASFFVGDIHNLIDQGRIRRAAE